MLVNTVCLSTNTVYIKRGTKQSTAGTSMECELIFMDVN